MENWQSNAKKMVRSQIESRGIKDPDLIKALIAVPRHFFVPEDQRHLAYEDIPLPIGMKQTISQPYIVALMTKMLKIKPGMKVLEIGSGSGYQAAILAEMGAKVHSVERIRSLALSSAKLLGYLGYDVNVTYGDGSLGIPEEAPFDRIIVTAGSFSISPVLLEQAGYKCRIVIPLKLTRDMDRLLTRIIIGKTYFEEWGEYCRFVPLLDGISE